MNHTTSQLRWVTLALLSGFATAGFAGDPHHKGAAHVGNGVAAAERAAMHQQAAMQRQIAASQRQYAEQSARMNRSGVTETNHHKGVHTNGSTGTNHRKGVYTQHHLINHTGQHHNSNTANSMVSSLHSVVSRLNQADHDYDGHRVQAIHQLNQAIHNLQSSSSGTRTGGTASLTGLTQAGMNRSGTSRSTGTGTGTGQRMSQAQSDAHLRQAHQELMALESHMSGSNGTNNSRLTRTGSAVHHQQAHGHVKQALQHLNTALATR